MFTDHELEKIVPFEKEIKNLRRWLLIEDKNPSSEGFFI